MTKVNILTLAILTIILVMFTGCIYKEEFFSETGKFISKTEKSQFNDLEITTELERTTFKKGEKISVLFILKNNGNNLVHLNDQGFDAGIYSSDGNLITYIRGNRERSKPVNLDKDISFIESVDWYQTYNEDNNEKYIESGKYYLIGYLKADVTYEDENGGYKVDSYTIKTKPIMITIE